MRRAAALLCLALAACGGARVPASNFAPGTASAASAAAPAGLAPACDRDAADLGPAIAEEAGYALHDSAPGSTEPRPHWITGFADGCPRQVTAALVLFGDVATHESIRYAAPGQPADATDAAYERIKAQVCGVREGEPCGAALDRLAADTVFVSLYPAFGSEDHRDLLLHAGEVVAADA